MGVVAPPARLVEVHGDVDARDGAEHAGLDLACGADVVAFTAALRADLHHAIAGLHRQIGGLGVSHRRRHWLFAEGVLAGLDRILQDPTVGEIWSGDDDGVDAFPSEQFAVVDGLAGRFRPDPLDHVRRALQGRPINIAKGGNGEVRLAAFLQFVEEEVSAAADSDDADADPVVGLCGGGGGGPEEGAARNVHR